MKAPPPGLLFVATVLGPAAALAFLERGGGTAPQPTAADAPTVVAADPCDTPVPDHVDLGTGRAAVHFYVPDPTWALAAGHVGFRSAQLQEDGLDLRISPSLVLATALQESTFGCARDHRPDVLHPGRAWPNLSRTHARGCFQIAPDTAWKELCRLYPGVLDCAEVAFRDAIAAVSGGEAPRDNFEPGAHALSWYLTFAYAMFGRTVGDVDQWMREATDPMARDKMLALAWNRGAWAGEVKAALRGCKGQLIERCTEPESVARHHVVNISRTLRSFEQAIAEGSCYAEPVSTDDVLRYLDAVGAILPERVDVHVRHAATEAFLAASSGADPAPFQQVAAATFAGIEAAWNMPLSCPDEELRRWYGFGCPLGAREEGDDGGSAGE